jgi:hypothetical protein
VKENIPISSVLDVFEKDSWIRDVWMYQEVTNSKQLHFVGDSFDNVLVEGQGSLGATGHLLWTLTKQKPSTLPVSRPLTGFGFILGHALWVFHGLSAPCCKSRQSMWRGFDNKNQIIPTT